MRRWKAEKEKMKLLVIEKKKKIQEKIWQRKQKQRCMGSSKVGKRSGENQRNNQISERYRQQSTQDG